MLSTLSLCFLPMGSLQGQLSPDIPLSIRSTYERLGYFDCMLISSLYIAWTTTGYAGYTVCSFYNVEGVGPLSIWVITKPEDSGAIHGEVYNGSSSEDGINLAKRWIDRNKFKETAPLGS